MEVIEECEPMEEVGREVAVVQRTGRRNLLDTLRQSILVTEEVERQSSMATDLIDEDISKSFHEIKTTLSDIYQNIKHFPIIHRDIVIIKNFRDFQISRQPIMSKYIFLYDNVYVFFLISFNKDRLMIQGQSKLFGNYVQSSNPSGWVTVTISLLDQPMTENVKEYKKLYSIEQVADNNHMFMDESVFKMKDFTGNYLVSDKAFLEISVDLTKSVSTSL